MGFGDMEFGKEIILGTNASTETPQKVCLVGVVY